MWMEVPSNSFRINAKVTENFTSASLHLVKLERKGAINWIRMNGLPSNILSGQKENQRRKTFFFLHLILVIGQYRFVTN